MLAERVSLKETSICVVDGSGRIVSEGTVISAPPAIAAFIKTTAGNAKRIGLETGPTSTWLWHELRALGLPVICIDARHAKAALSLQITRATGATHFLMKTLPRVATEMALHVLAYNLTRVINILGTGPLMAAMRA